jgi:hypothetical protein
MADTDVAKMARVRPKAIVAADGRYLVLSDADVGPYEEVRQQNEGETCYQGNLDQDDIAA